MVLLRIDRRVIYMDEVVKHHNDLNTVIMRTWNTEEMNFFFAILSKAKEKGTSKLRFNTDELKSLVNYSKKHKQRWEETMKSCARKVAQLTYFEETENRFRILTMFNCFDILLDERIVEVELSPNFEYIINRLEANFTTYELREFTSIRSTYAKTMYRLLKQWRTIGRKEFKVNDFKRLLDMPQSYKSSEIDRAVVKPIINQLSPYFEGLKVKKVKSNKRGNPVLAYEFTWKKEKTGVYVPNKFSKPKHKETTNIPSWSDENYKNTTTKDEKDILNQKRSKLLARLKEKSN